MINIKKEQIHFAFNPAETPVAYADNGDIVKFCCQDCYCEQILSDGFNFNKMNMQRNNPATGPLYVRGAEPGDVLRVEIKAIDLAAEGSMCARTGAGIYEIDGCHCRRFSIENDLIVFDNEIRIPIRPMIGVIGTAPKKDIISTQTPGEHGGNLDINDLGVDAVLYLPVNVPGALLSMGDIHAVQGDGETVICALEMSGEVTVKVNVLKNRQDIPTPFIITDSHYITTAADPSLDNCSVIAAQKMHRFLQQHSNLTDAQSGLLLSLAGNLRISQIVNPAKGCIMEFPIGLAKEKFEK
ncbi:MAG: acetamidase/formamidase family protein [Herbinix sp.]|nr:acetamidase/formamidase family protein [Herbinix sp.]